MKDYNKPYVVDDGPVVKPDYIKNMPKEELDAEIAKMEEEARKERDRLRNNKKSATA